MNDDRFRQALETALRKLKASDRFESEIRAALNNYEPETVERVIVYLKDRKMLDDIRTASNLIERKTGKRSVGFERLRAELIARGAGEQTVEKVLADDGENERERIDQALAGKFTPADDRLRAARFLASRGFEEEAIESALVRFFGDTGFPE